MYAMCFLLPKFSNACLITHKCFVAYMKLMRLHIVEMPSFWACMAHAFQAYTKLLESNTISKENTTFKNVGRDGPPRCSSSTERQTYGGK